MAVVHSSQHMRIATNTTPDGARSVYTEITLLEMKWVAGELQVRFASRGAAAPTSTAPMARGRRGRA